MPPSLRRLRAIWVKELRHIVRDRRSLSLALFLPVMMLLLYGYALSLDVDHIPTMIYDQSDTDASRDLIKRFQGSRYFDVMGFVRGYPPIERAIDRGKILMGVVIPRDYGKQEGSGRIAPVQLLLDGSDSNTASIALGYAESVVNDYSLTLRSDAQNRCACASGTTARSNPKTTWCRA
jgi:ABC-2 type transport system permease protein